MNAHTVIEGDDGPVPCGNHDGAVMTSPVNMISDKTDHHLRETTPMTRNIPWSAIAGLATLGVLGGVTPASAASPTLAQCPAIAYGPVQQAPAPLKAAGRYFKDAQGRVVLLRGVNATGDAKVPPFKGITSAAQLDALPVWGLNVIRLLFTWEAFEPTRCQYDDSYLAYYEQVVQWAAQRGVYVIVDFHQDAYSRFTLNGCGEGFPAWTIPAGIKAKTPRNDNACKGWGTKMLLDLPHHDTWHAFHADTEGALTRYLEMTRAVADRMAAHPNVIGYDVMNEPWGTHAELLKMYEKVGAAIRERHPDAILFTSPNAMVSLGYIADVIEQPKLSNTAYSPHYYDTTVMSLRYWLGFDVGAPLGRMLTKANGRKAPMLLGEFGAPANAQRSDDYLEAIYTWLDEQFVSGTQWSYTPQWTADQKDGWNAEDFSIVTNGQVRAKLFTPRPYPQKTAGTPGAFKRSAKGLSYGWTHEPSAGATELFLPEGYLTGKAVKINPAGSLDCQPAPPGLRCQGHDRGQVSVVITPP